ncbi:MAG TPA: Spy/CpxP family protein refolding chaperone [Stellaceae bacterium]|nr:Spy/CpxP family protein refolding chaperone [Stellaceae bacterium]
MKSRALVSLPVLLFAAALAGSAPAGLAQTSMMSAQSGQTPGPGAMPGWQGQGGMMGGGMRGMMMGGGAAGWRGGMMVDHVEGRLAFLKTELKITDAQMPLWSSFADALRSTAAAMNGMHQQMMQGSMPDTLPARLDLRERMLSAHLEALKSMRAALDPLYAALSDEQKKLADELMVGRMGMM